MRQVLVLSEEVGLEPVEENEEETDLHHQLQLLMRWINGDLLQGPSGLPGKIALAQALPLDLPPQHQH